MDCTEQPPETTPSSTTPVPAPRAKAEWKHPFVGYHLICSILRVGEHQVLHQETRLAEAWLRGRIISLLGQIHPPLRD